MAEGRIAVLDVGKSNLKATLIDASTLGEVAGRRAPSVWRQGGPYPHADVEHAWAFLMDALRDFAALGPVEAVSLVAHGATAALVDAEGALALPVLDYEFAGPDARAAAYDPQRPPYGETGSPRLPGGLNVGAQLDWLEATFPDAFARARHLLPWAQYWTYRLSGVAAAEATSLGSHTDLWNPWRGLPSSLAVARGWDRLLPPLRRASDVLGPIRPEVAAATGLSPGTPVLSGIHDSNASLLPHLLGRAEPFAVVSSGTWVVCLAVGAAPVALDPGRDLLVNVDALGRPVPSARFMGGRDRETLLGGSHPLPTAADRAGVLGREVMLLPSVTPGSGPFPGRAASWTTEPAGEGELAVALSWHLALMTATCLDLIGARGPVLVEGPLAADEDLAAMLGAATGRPVGTSGGDATGTAAGAALLARPALAPRLDPPPGQEPDPALVGYARRWRARVEAAG